MNEKDLGLTEPQRTATMPRTEATTNETSEAMIYCAKCGEQSDGQGTSFWGHVHKWGPTTHKFKPTHRKP